MTRVISGRAGGHRRRRLGRGGARHGAIGALMVTHGVEEALLLGTRVVVMAPNPGRIARIFEPPFATRWRGGEPLRALKADPAFAAARAELAAAIFEGEPA